MTGGSTDDEFLSLLLEYDIPQRGQLTADLYFNFIQRNVVSVDVVCKCVCVLGVGGRAVVVWSAVRVVAVFVDARFSSLARQRNTYECMLLFVQCNPSVHRRVLCVCVATSTINAERDREFSLSLPFLLSSFVLTVAVFWLFLTFATLLVASPIKLHWMLSWLSSDFVQCHSCVVDACVCSIVDCCCLCDQGPGQWPGVCRRLRCSSLLRLPISSLKVFLLCSFFVHCSLWFVVRVHVQLHLCVSLCASRRHGLCWLC